MPWSFQQSLLPLLSLVMENQHISHTLTAVFSLGYIIDPCVFCSHKIVQKVLCIYMKMDQIWFIHLRSVVFLIMAPF